MLGLSTEIQVLALHITFISFFIHFIIHFYVIYVWVLVCVCIEFRLLKITFDWNQLLITNYIKIYKVGHMALKIDDATVT